MRPSSTKSHFTEISDVLVGDDINIDLWAWVFSRAVTTLLQLTGKRSGTKRQRLFTQQINAPLAAHRRHSSSSFADKSATETVPEMFQTVSRM